MYEARSLDVALGARPVLQGVSMSAAPGRVTGVIGPNGSGKSTLLRTLCGDIAPTAGAVTLDGRSIAKMRAQELAARRAMLSQSTVLSFPFTVAEVVRLGLTNGAPGLSPERFDDIIREALATVGLTDFAGRFMQELSGGEQQRAHLARTLCQVWSPVFEGTPRYLFLDEPTSSLDLKHQLTVLRVARRFAEQGGGVLMVLHDLNLAAMAVDHLICIAPDGTIRAVGSPREVMTDAVLADLYDAPLQVDVAASSPFVLPQSAVRIDPDGRWS